MLTLQCLGVKFVCIAFLLALVSTAFFFSVNMQKELSVETGIKANSFSISHPCQIKAGVGRKTGNKAIMMERRMLFALLLQLQV